MPQLYARVEMPYTTGLSDDLAVNTFMFNSPTGVQDLAQSAANVAILLQAFYTITPDSFGENGQTLEPQGSISGELSPVLSRLANAATISMYDATTHLDEDDMGAPIFVLPWTLTPNSGDGLPPNVSVVLTWEGEGRRTAPVETGGIRPKQRRTGHIKIGPLATTVLETTGTGIGRPTQAFLTKCLGAANMLENNLQQLDTEWHIAVWSRRDAEVYDIEAVSIDDAFDTLASRELAPTMRRRLPT